MAAVVTRTSGAAGPRVNQSVPGSCGAGSNGCGTQVGTAIGGVNGLVLMDCALKAWASRDGKLKCMGVQIKNVQREHTS
jgi:hypothetical protein